MRRRGSFERFYLEKVAVGEGCGCSEQIIGMRDMDALSRQAALRKAARDGDGARWSWIRRFFRRRAGVTRSAGATRPSVSDRLR